jgi:hypothetical protein
MGTFIIAVIGSVVAGVIVILGRRYWRTIRIILSNRRQKRMFFDRLIEHGVNNFYFSRSDFRKYRDGDTLEAYLQNAKRTVKIIALWLAESIEMEGLISGLEKILQKDDFRIMKIAVINPDSEIVGPLSRLLDIPEGDVKSKIRKSIESLCNLKKRLKTSVTERLQVRVYDTLPIASVIMLDDGEENGRIQFDFKIYRTPRVKSFGFELRNTGNVFYQLCKEKYNLLLSESEEFSS